MTKQILDQLIYQGWAYAILSVSGEGLTSPLDFGMHPFPMHTGCSRGYILGYTCAGASLFLTRMVVRTTDGHFPTIDGANPTLDEDIGDYTDLRVKVPFSGGLLIAVDIKKVRRDYFWPSDYGIVKELLFEEGTLIADIDHSAHVTAISEALQRDDTLAQREIDWGFSQDYNLRYYG